MTVASCVNVSIEAGPAEKSSCDDKVEPEESFEKEFEGESFVDDDVKTVREEDKLDCKQSFIKFLARSSDEKYNQIIKFDKLDNHSNYDQNSPSAQDPIVIRFE